MTHEQKKINPEESTKDNDNMVLERSTPDIIADINSSAAKVLRNPSTGNLGYHQGNGRGKSAFTRVGDKGGNDGLFHCFKLCGKRKLEESFANINSASDIRFDSDAKKRLKSGECCHNNYRKKGCNHRINYGKSFSSYCNSSFEQNARLNGISKGAARKIDFNFDAMSSFNPEKVRVDTQETEKLNSLKKSRVDLGNTNNLTNVGEAECLRHNASFSKNERTRNEHSNNISNSSLEFISLDATKSSFLTQVIKLRQKAECNTPILCPFCSKPFAKYPDLKSHVQMHQNSGIPRIEIKKDDSSQAQVLTSGNTMLTPVSTHSPRLPSRPQNSGDDAVIPRATSVIQFAQKKKENARK